MTIAWTIAALERQKKLPTLASLTAPARTRAAQPSIESQKAVLHVLSAQYGIPLRTRKKARG